MCFYNNNKLNLLFDDSSIPNRVNMLFCNAIFYCDFLFLRRRGGVGGKADYDIIQDGDSPSTTGK